MIRHFIAISCLLFQFSVAEQYIFDLSQYNTSSKMISRGNIGGFDNTSSDLFSHPSSIARFTNLSITNYFISSMDNEVRFTHLSLTICLYALTLIC